MDEAGALCIDFEGLVQFSVPTKRIWCKYIWNFAENVYLCAKSRHENVREPYKSRQENV